MDFPGGLETRAGGILVHPGSLPGPGASGRLDAGAYAFVDWLADAGFRAWQMPPIAPVDDGRPDQPLSAFAGDTRLIDPDGPIAADGRDASRRCHGAWLGDWALFAALRRHLDRPWREWPPALRDRERPALDAARAEHAAAIDAELRAQSRFEHQWQALRAYAAGRGVRLFGELPLYCAHDSADAWARRDLLALDDTGRITAEAGAPPDAFAEAGRRCGRPLHDWAAHASEGWRWWIERVRVLTRRFDLLRVARFRDFAAAWSIPAGAADARAGAWIAGPGREPFDAIADALGALPLVADDLGASTADVEVLRSELGLPGVRVLQHAFDGDAGNPHRPENHPQWSVAYTGAHAHHTTLGWWRSLDAEARAAACATLDTDGATMPGPAIDAVLGSRARLAVLPLPDLLALDGGVHGNVPVGREGSWRCPEGVLDAAAARAWRTRLVTAGRGAASSG